jgi:hypothetical protein
MWTLLEGVTIIRRIQDSLREKGYHACLGGGVLNQGGSKRDLDIFILRMNNTNRVRPIECVWSLSNILQPCTYSPLRDNPDYGPDADFHFSEAHRFTYNGKRIDVFVQ